MSNRKRNHVIEELIELYKSEPCLWRLKSVDYHNRAKKEAAYKKLTTKLRELEPDATKDTVVRKINNLRSNVRKEKKKYEASKKSGASADDLYKPGLWYYDLFDFLGDKNIANTSISNLDDEESEIDDVSERKLFIINTINIIL